MKKTISFMLLVILIGCAAPQQKSFDKTEIREYKIAVINPPKHFYVDLIDVETGKYYTHVYVSKHCNDYRKWKVGDTVKLKRVYWTDEGKEISDFEDIYKTLCE